MARDFWVLFVIAAALALSGCTQYDGLESQDSEEVPNNADTNQTTPIPSELLEDSGLGEAVSELEEFE